MRRVNTAVILAAGIGSRLKNQICQKPKGFIKIGNRPIIERSICNLQGVGISRIIIGTGFLSKYYEALEDKQTIFCVKSHSFADTGSFFTLYNLYNHLHEDFLLLESDILYEKRALDVLLNHHKKNVILASGKTSSGDEVFIEVNKENCLFALSKNINDLSDIYGELVGISKVSIDTYKKLSAWAKRNVKQAKKIHYEEALAEISDKKDIYIEKINDLVWTEIDTEEHYRRALDYVYPKLLKKEIK